MDRPREAELRRLIGFVAEWAAAAPAGTGQLADVVLAELAELVSGDHAVRTHVGGGPRGAIAWASTDPRVAASRRRDRDRWVGHIAEHPIVSYWERSRTGSAVRASDLIGQRAYRRLPIYAYFFEPFGIEYNLALRVSLARGGRVDFSVCRKHRDFSDRERDLLESLRPYLTVTLRRAEAGSIARPLLSRFGLSLREAQVLALVATGRSNREVAAMLFLSPLTVRKHLEHVYAKLGVRTRTEAAAVAMETLSGWDDGAARSLLDPYLRRTPLAGSEREASVTPTVLGLTKREAEVLTLAVSGKSNREIAAALALATGTVKKHLDRIYAKLGVHHRAEAAVRMHALQLTTGTSAVY